MCAFLAVVTDWEERWKLADGPLPPPVWAPWGGSVFPDPGGPLDDKFAARLDALVAETKAYKYSAGDRAEAAGSGPGAGGKEKLAAAAAEPDPLSDYALRLVHLVVRSGLPPFPPALIVWPYYHEFWEGYVPTTQLEGVGVYSYSVAEDVDIGHAVLIQRRELHGAARLRYGQHGAGGACEVVEVRFGPGAPACGSDEPAGAGEEPGAAPEGRPIDRRRRFDMSRVLWAFGTLDRAAQDVRPCAEILAYAAAHPGALDLPRLWGAAEAHNARVRGLLRALYFTLRFVHAHKDDLPALPPWEPWDGDVLSDARADPQRAADLVTAGRISEYGWRVAEHVSAQGVPKQPALLLQAHRKAEAWRAAQARARGCQHCRRKKRTVTPGPAGPASHPHSAHAAGSRSTGTQATVGHDYIGPSWAFDVFPDCSHSPSERGDRGGGGGSSGGGGWSSGGGGGSSGGGGGGGSSSFDSGGGGGGGCDSGGGSSW